MPTMPQKAAGWRIEPPVSVPVAPRHARAATAAAEPPDEPLPGIGHRAERAGGVRRAHGEFVEVGLAERDRARRLELGGHGRFVLRDEVAENFRGSGRLHGLCAKKILDGDWQTFERAAVALGEARIRFGGRLLGQFRGLGDVGVERARRLDRLDVGVGDLGSGKLFRLEAVSGFRQGQIGERAHSTTFGTAK
jgi:hypothetical protein